MDTIRQGRSESRGQELGSASEACTEPSWTYSEAYYEIMLSLSYKPPAPGRSSKRVTRDSTRDPDSPGRIRCQPRPLVREVPEDPKGLESAVLNL